MRDRSDPIVDSPYADQYGHASVMHDRQFASAHQSIQHLTVSSISARIFRSTLYPQPFAMRMPSSRPLSSARPLNLPMQE